MYIYRGTSWIERNNGAFFYLIEWKDQQEKNGWLCQTNDPTKAKHVIAGLNLLHELKTEYDKEEIDNLATRLLSIVERYVVPPLFPIEEPGVTRPVTIPCRHCKGIAIRPFDTPWFYICPCGGRYDYTKDEWSR